MVLLRKQHQSLKTNGESLQNSILSRTEPVTEVRRSVYRTNDAGNGIELILPTYLLSEDSHFESFVWTPDERGLSLKENNFTNQQRFRTDIYHIYKKKGPSDFICWWHSYYTLK